MITKESILSTLQELKPTLCEEYAVERIGLFGSFLDNTNTDISDIDIIVELERPIGWKFFSLELYLEKVFNRKIDLVTKNAIKEQIKDSILHKVDFAF